MQEQQTALMWAVKNDRPQMVKKLIKANADLSATDAVTAGLGRVRLSYWVCGVLLWLVILVFC